MSSPVPSPSLSTQITEVTVYTDQAQVTRRGLISLTGEERELVLTGLPTSLRSESVRASGAGRVTVRLLGVRTEKIYATEPVAERVAQLTTQLQQLEDQKRSLQDRLEALRLQQNFVQGLGEKSIERISQALARQQIGLEQTNELLNFLGQRYTDYADAISGLERQGRELTSQIQALSQQLQQVRTPRPRESFSLFIAIQPQGGGDFELEVSYVVSRASWTPLYDLRLNAAGDSLNLTYLAEVQQNSGEDWTDIALNLSTAKPGLGTLPPKLEPWYIDILRPPVPMGGTLLAAAAPAALDEQAAPLQRRRAKLAKLDDAEVFQAENISAEVANQGGVVTFSLDRDSTIPSDGAPHKLTVFSHDYPGRSEYVAMPRRVSFAYLQTTITNPADGVTLLPGPANLFRDQTFVGTTSLDNIAPGQAFKLNLGIDEGLSIERDLVEREVDKRFISGQRRTTYAYRLKLTNLRDCPAPLTLSEQLPVSRHEQIKVRLSRSQPQIPLSEMGLLAWSLTLPPNAKQELFYQFSVEHPADLTVVGLEV